MLTLASCAAITALAAPAQAQREHTVREGQSLARIARRHHVSVANLAAANGLGRHAGVRPGQVLRIPEDGTHYVAPGETLTSIAQDHECSIADLRTLNRLSAGRAIRVGQRLVLPGHQTETQREEESRWGRPRSPGVATLYRQAIERRLRVRLVDRRGRARRVAQRRLQEMMRPRGSRPGRLGRAGPAPPRRLVEILARVSDHFGGRQITLVSGYRQAGGNTRESSRHTRGHALDLRVRGVPNHVLRDFIRSSFREVGVGYYPRSSFVHVDVRDRTAYWVDWSRPGERPRYQRRGDSAPTDASRAEIRRTGVGGDSDGEDEGDAASADRGPTADGDESMPAEHESGDDEG